MTDLGMAVMTSAWSRTEVEEMLAATGRWIGAAEEAVVRINSGVCTTTCTTGSVLSASTAASPFDPMPLQSCV
jgi:hypothetical protein